MKKNNLYGIIALFIAFVLILSVFTAGCTSNGEPEQDQQPQNDTNEESQNGEDETQQPDLSGTTTYCGTWEGSFVGQGDVSGEWQFTVDFDSGDVTGWFEGDGAGDITGSVEDGIIEASGSAALGTVNWSGSFNLEGTEISGEWEVTEDMGSGTWKGTEGKLEESTEDSEEDGTGESETNYWQPYQFDEEVHYKYSFTIEDQTGTFSWDISSVNDDQVTVETEINLDGGQSISNTFTSDKDSIEQEISGTPIGSFITAGLYNPMIPYFAEDGLNVGNEWTVTTPDETVTIKVTGTETYSGIESYVGEVKLDGVVVFESAIAKDLGFPTYVAGYDKDNPEEMQVEFILEEYGK